MAQPQFEMVPTGENRAFIFKIDRDIWPVYHYHPEFDILLSLKDHAGEFISGDYIGRLDNGTLIMNGPNIPHAVHSGKQDDRDWSRPSLAVIQFSRESLGEDFLRKVEMQVIRDFLDAAQFGFEFFGRTAGRARELILSMENEPPLERMLLLLKLLRLFAESEEKQTLASPAYSPSLKDRDISRLDRILHFLRERKTEPVRLEEVAKIAGMSPKSFCRFFRANTGKTLVQYLNALRIGEACRMLVESDMPISEIALESGFSNLSNFNRRFRELKGVTPRQFRSRIFLDPAEQNQPLPPSLG